MNTESLAISVCRWILGLLILLFGANGIFHFIPVPPYPPKAERFRQALVDTGYMLPLWKGVELIGSLLLLANRAVPFALVLLAPVLVNIFLFHLFLCRRGLWLASILMLGEVFLVVIYRDAYLSLF